MTLSHAADAASEAGADKEQVVERDRPRLRDAARTQATLLQAARRLFAVNGYADTTVREIAHEAGVNVALINRYFGSKEGLFEACLTDGNQQIRTAVGEVADLRTLGQTLATKLIGLGSDPLPLLLLLRTSGDERAERIRLGFLRTISERIAVLAGSGPEGDDDTLLRAQLLLGAAIGAAVLRSSREGLEPLASAMEEDLVEPLNDMIRALFGH